MNADTSAAKSDLTTSPSDANHMNVIEHKPWEIIPGMGLNEQALRSAFNPERKSPNYEGIQITPDLVKHLLDSYLDELGDAKKPDDALIGLVSDFLK